MTVLQPFLDIIASLYAGIMAVKNATGALAKTMAGVQLLSFAAFVPAAITNAPSVLGAIENLSDADRKSVEAYITGKIPGLTAAQVTKLIYGIDALVRLGGTVPDFIGLFSTVADAPAAPIVASASKPEAEKHEAPKQPSMAATGKPAKV